MSGFSFFTTRSAIERPQGIRLTHAKHKNFPLVVLELVAQNHVELSIFVNKSDSFHSEVEL
jgi:hypothetical protein